MTCSCHVRAPTSPDLIRIRSSFLYLDRRTLVAALEDVRVAVVDPTSVRCWISDPTTLFVEVTLPMFADHEPAFQLCDSLARRAVVVDANVRAHSA